jgi:hypothetical protein
VKVPDETAKGFDLVDELKTNTLGVGFTADQVAGYVKEAKAHRIDAAYVSTITLYPLDHSAKVVMSGIDAKVYAVIKITLVGRAADKMIGFYKVVSDVTKR